ncbi:MAG: hypothetical protein EBU90_28235 [Proteobacteria bacterium]|nr:hypothetical protein [Pseudomonadota bacterium]
MKIRKIFRKYLLPDTVKSEKTTEKSNSESVAVTRVINPFPFENKDFMLLSKCSVSQKIKEIINSNILIICNLHDRNGKFGLKVVDLEVDYTTESVSVIMTGSTTHPLDDKFLYNLIYNPIKKQYSLEEHDEYFEKIEVDEN